VVVSAFSEHPSLPMKREGRSRGRRRSATNDQGAMTFKTGEVA